MLKLVTFLLFLAVSLYFGESEAYVSSEDIKKLGEKCNSTDADLNILLKYDIPDSETGKCFMLCLLKDLKLLTEAGEYVEDTVFSSLKRDFGEIADEGLKKVAQNCAEYIKPFSNQKNTCEHGYITIKCLNYNLKALKLLNLPPNY